MGWKEDARAAKAARDAMERGERTPTDSAPVSARKPTRRPEPDPYDDDAPPVIDDAAEGARDWLGAAGRERPASGGTPTAYAPARETTRVTRPMPPEPRVTHEPTRLPVPVVEPTETAEERERQRNDRAWVNPNAGGYLTGYVADSPTVMGEGNFRRGLGRWFYSFFTGIPYTRQTTGTRFTLRKDDVDSWTRNVIIYGEVYGGFLTRDSRVRVAGRLDPRNGDLIAQDVQIENGPYVSRVDIQRAMSAASVRLVTLAIILLIALIAGPVAMLIAGAATDASNFARNAYAYLRVNLPLLIFYLIIILYILHRIRRWFRRF